MPMPLRRYADFSGRSRRKEYWLFSLFVAIVLSLGFIGSIVVLVFVCLEGTRGPNRFGLDPKAGERAAA
jgi:uncharacterized membrane protein YhaH (DUF805 family)